MWQPISIPTIADPAAAQAYPSRQAIARQAYLDKKRSQAAQANSVSSSRIGSASLQPAVSRAA